MGIELECGKKIKISKKTLGQSIGRNEEARVETTGRMLFCNLNSFNTCASPPADGTPYHMGLSFSVSVFCAPACPMQVLRSLRRGGGLATSSSSENIYDTK